MTLTDKQAERLWDLLMDAIRIQRDPESLARAGKRLPENKKEFVEILTWGSATEKGKR